MFDFFTILYSISVTVCVSGCVGNPCPDNFLPFAASDVCIRVFSSPTLNFSAAERMTRGKLVALENSTLLRIRFHATIAGVSGAIWISSSFLLSERNVSNSTSCPSLENDGSTRERSCSDKLPYAVVLDISGKMEFCS